MNDVDHRIEPEEAVAAAIDEAEEVRDPLDGLVERAATDPAPLCTRSARTARRSQEERPRRL